MSIINEALRKTQQSRKNDMERKQQAKVAAAVADAKVSAPTKAATTKAAVTTKAAATSKVEVTSQKPAAVRKATTTQKSHSAMASNAEPKPIPVETSQSSPSSQSTEKKSRNVQRAQFNFTWRMASMLTVAAMLALMALANSDRIVKQVNAILNPSANLAAQTQTTQVTDPNLQNKVRVAFEGIFTTDDAKIALINKQSLHVGDTIGGMRIVAINEDSVDLQTSNGIVEIKAGATYML